MGYFLMADKERKDKANRPDPNAPVCNASYKDRHGIERRCKKRGFHLKHGQ